MTFDQPTQKDRGLNCQWRAPATRCVRGSLPCHICQKPPDHDAQDNAYVVRSRNGNVASSGAADSSTKNVPSRSISSSIKRRPFSAEAQCG